ncbi:MAG: replication protein [Chlamydiae bacterium]|nr:replication protein [Chlamydiota bacterium]
MRKLKEPVPFSFVMDHIKASPQLENGYIRIANELFSALKQYPFNGAELRILIAIMEKTYGWRKKKELIPFSQISKATGINLRYVKKIIKRLARDGVIFKEESRDGNFLGVNKNYYGWRLWIAQTSDNQKDTRHVGRWTS